MFLTVTLNPALDKTLQVDHNAPRETLRATRRIDLAGGKGVNVARALLALGAKARALMPLGGHPGAQVADLARAEGMEVVAVPVAGVTRAAITIRVPGSRQYWHNSASLMLLHVAQIVSLSLTSRMDRDNCSASSRLVRMM